ncbi:MAG: hypothetical protein EG823_02470 [Actinobacteria bacterium]|nr:hypothetical protein [Actinomycetota bacterium]
MRIVAILMGFVMTASFIFTIVRFRKPRPIAWWTLLLSIAVSAVVLPIMVLIGGVPFGWVAGLILYAAGLFVGLLWGFTVKLTWQQDRPIARNSILWLFFFFLSTMFTYGLMVFAPATLVGLGALTAAFPSGMGIGTNANVLVRVLAKAGA